MSLSSVQALLVTAASESESGLDPAPVPPWVVGAIALGILLALLIGLITFGGGREHS